MSWTPEEYRRACERHDRHVRAFGIFLAIYGSALLVGLVAAILGLI